MTIQRLRRLALLCIGTLTFALSGCGSANGPDLLMDEDTNASDTDLACPAGSFYDAEEDVCFIDCEGLTDDQCDDLDIAIFGEFDEFIDESFSGPQGDNQTMLDAENTIARYAVGPDLTLTSIENLESGSDDHFRQIWQSAIALLPSKVLGRTLSEYQVSSDGKDGLLAFVMLDENNPGKWLIGFDNEDYTDGKEAEFVHTTVHEFGHIVFLGEGQVDLNEFDNCANYEIDEGCATSDSYINQFYQQFWTSIIDEHSVAIEFGEESEAMFEFYEKHQNQFISDYAATNPVEDAAETFTRFVLNSKPKENKLVTQQKILFLYQFSELVKLRNIIRGKLLTG